MKEDESYAKNVELLARDNPLEAYRLEETDCSHFKFFRTLENELNLVDESQDKPFYFHDQGGAMWAAEQWAKKLPLEGCDVLFVYGLGLGYYYLPLKAWLADSSHSLVFLEDNPCVVHYFLQTDLAAEILNNNQVTIKLLPRVELNEDGWEQLREAAAPLFWAFALSKPHISALHSYFYSRFDYFHAFSLQWLTGLANAGRRLGEFYPHSPLVFHNFYANMMNLADTIPGYRLANAMQGIPALLCGAGPSLAKQLPLLKTLSDQAFLMASGSAMNAVTQASIIPHVGGAIDPTPVQANRQLTSFAYEVPAFYQNRFYGPALTQWRGPLLYMPGSGSYRVSEWFEKELGIQDAEQLIMGVSTSNFLLEIAHFLGCNPIILIGMDLAYTNDQRYAEGISEDPSEVFKNAGRILAPSADGGEVYTTNQWFYEAVCIAAFKQRNPKVLCMNATEGGMAIPSVPNVVFSQVVDEYLTHSWDIEGWFHGAIQNAGVYKISSDKVFRSMEKWKRSLEACVHYLELLMGGLKTEEKTALREHELFQEPAYTFLLDTLNTVFETVNSLRKRKLKWTNDLKEQREIALERYRFLHLYAADHLKSVVEGIKAFEERKAALSEKVEQKERLKEPVLPPEYDIDDNQVNGLREGQTHYFYPDGSLKAEGFYRAGKLHGPWSFFSPQGILLYRSLFIEGKREGKVHAYYSDGALYSITGYSDGISEGQHLYYYPDGTLKTVVSYKKGKFDGVVRLYHSNGRLKKEQHFVQGKLAGVEKMWDEWGKLVLENRY